MTIEKFNDFIFEKFNGVVQDGIFKNLKFKINRLGLHSKILGIYENQLQMYIKDAINKKPNLIINIGCGDGYYGLGIANILKESKCILVDTNKSELQSAEQNAQANNLLNVEFKLNIEDEEINELCSSNDKSFIIIDAEGWEINLLDHEKFNQFQNASLLIECHDFIHKNITNNLINKFLFSHKIFVIDDCKKSIMFDFLDFLTLEDKLFIQSEGRPTAMKWLYMSPK